MDMARVDLGSEKIENAQQVCFSPPPCWLAPCHSTGRLNRIVYTKGIHSRVSIDTLYWYPQLILLIDTRDQFPQWIPLIDTRDQFPQSIPLFNTHDQFPQSIPLIDSLNQFPQSIPLIDTIRRWPIPAMDILNRQFIDTLVYTQSTITLSTSLSTTCMSVKHQLILDWLIWVGWNSADYRPTVDRVLTKYRLRCRSNIDWDADWGYQSRVSINTQPRMTEVHMILGKGPQTKGRDPLLLAILKRIQKFSIR